MKELPAFVAINDPRVGRHAAERTTLETGSCQPRFKGTDFSAKSPPKNLEQAGFN